MVEFKHASIPDKKFNQRQLRMGIKIELEHTNSRKIAKSIAKAHLVENPKYYTYLKAMEKKMKEDERKKFFKRRKMTRAEREQEYEDLGLYEEYARDKKREAMEKEGWLEED